MGSVEASSPLQLVNSNVSASSVSTPAVNEPQALLFSLKSAKASTQDGTLVVLPALSSPLFVVG